MLTMFARGIKRFEVIVQECQAPSTSLSGAQNFVHLFDFLVEGSRKDAFFLNKGLFKSREHFFRL